jgi:Ca-activated chloride channel family protein
MIEPIDIETFGFAEPLYLWLLIVPAMLLGMWIWRVLRRRADVRQYRRQRMVPVRERYGWFGDLAFWSCLIIATALCIVALARPQARILVDRTGIDIVILQDASASMYVSDVLPNRWQRSQQFLRAFADALTWKDDRVALALFARRAAPQLRLTKDPNSLFFFLDHLGEHSPFSLDDDATWDTNIEEGLYWGLKLVAKDEELFGKNKNVKSFVVISDGQAWSGNVKNALAVARLRHIPVYVVGVGTVAGDLIPEPKGEDGRRPPAKIRAVLDRQSLQEIARAGGGEYFEIGREPDRDLAFKLIANVRHSASNSNSEKRVEEVYWRFLLAAAVFIGLGTLLLDKRAELLWQAAGALISLALLVSVLRG